MERSLTCWRAVRSNTSVGCVAAASRSSVSSTFACPAASAMILACCGVMSPSARACAVPARSASRPANWTSRFALRRDCRNRSRTTSAALAWPSRRANSPTVSERTAASAASHRPMRPSRSSSRSPPSERNPTSNASNRPSTRPTAPSSGVGDTSPGRTGRRHPTPPSTPLPGPQGAWTAGEPPLPETATRSPPASSKRVGSVIVGSPQEFVGMHFASAGPTSRSGNHLLPLRGRPMNRY